MVRATEIDFISNVADEIRRLGYEVTQKPSRIPNHSPWRDSLTSLIGGPRYRPDILVEHGNRFVLVETSTRPVLLGSVVQARNYALHFDTEVILCVPDSALPEILQSVRTFAEENDVRLCSQSEIGNALDKILR